MDPFRGAGLTVVYASFGLLVGELDRIIREVLGAWSGVGYVVLAVVIGLGGAVMVLRPAVSCRVMADPPRAHREPSCWACHWLCSTVPPAPG